MGSMKQRRRKRLARKWVEFQEEHQLSDEDIKLLRQTGYPLHKLTEKLSAEAFDSGTPLTERIRQLHRQWTENLEARRAAVDAGLIEPKERKKQKAKVQHDPAWAKAKKVCRLNMEDIRIAKELGLSPRTLTKNVPSPTEQWKAPVKIWIRELYEKREESAARKQAQRAAASSALTD
jgi:DNA-binding transcriptional MerR regulator